MNTETNISPAPVRRLGGLSNLLASAGAGGNWEVENMVLAISAAIAISVAAESTP